MRGRSGFRARYARSFRLRLLAEAFAYFAQNGGSGIALDDGNGDDAAAGGFHFLAANDLVARPIAAFYQDVGEEAGNHFAGRHVIENHHCLHGFQSGKNR